MKGTDVICINSNFEEGYLKWAAKNSVKLPIKDKMYTVRGVKKHSNGETGLLLEEINNPEVEQMGGIFSIEPDFNIKRFTTLLNEPIKIEEEINAEVG